MKRTEGTAEQRMGGIAEQCHGYYYHAATQGAVTIVSIHFRNTKRPLQTLSDNHVTTLRISFGMHLMVEYSQR